MPKARLKDDYVKRAKNRLKAMKKGTDNDIGEGKQAQNKGDIRTMMQLGQKTRARIRALIKLKPEATARLG